MTTLQSKSIISLACLVAFCLGSQAFAEDAKTVSVYEWGKIGVVRDSITRIMPFEEQIRVLKPYHECRLVCCCERGLCCGRLVPVEVLREEIEIATRDRRFLFAPPLECWLGTVSPKKDKEGKVINGEFEIDLKDQLTLFDHQLIRFDEQRMRFQGSVRPPGDGSIEEPPESLLSKASWSSKEFTQQKVEDADKDQRQVILVWNLAHDLKLPKKIEIGGDIVISGQLATDCTPMPNQPIKCDVLNKFVVTKIAEPKDYKQNVRIVMWGMKANEKGTTPGFLNDAFQQVWQHFLIEQEVKFLVKPFPIGGLINCVRELLG